MRRKIIALSAIAALVTAILPGSVASANKSPAKPSQESPTTANKSPSKPSQESPTTANKSPSKPGQGSPTTPQPTLAVHAGALSGTVSVDGMAAGDVSGSLSLEVDQTGVNLPIAHANLNLPSGFTWVGASVTVTSNENLAGAVNQGTVTYSGNTLSVSGLSLTDTDEDGAVEFTLLAENADISTTVMTAGSYGVSSQYRTNPNRKIKEQTWVLSSPGLITLNAPEVDACSTDPFAAYSHFRLNAFGESATGFAFEPEVSTDGTTWGSPFIPSEAFECFTFTFQEDQEGWVNITANPYTMSYGSILTLGEGATITYAPDDVDLTTGYTGMQKWDFDRPRLRLLVIWDGVTQYSFTFPIPE